MAGHSLDKGKQPLITVKEARKLLDKKARELLSDTEVQELINQLDFLAQLAFKYDQLGKTGRRPE